MRGMPMLSLRKKWVVIWPALAALCLAGCNANRPYPVRGKVLYENGQAATDLVGRSVLFTSPERKIVSQGLIQPDGTYVLSSTQEGDGAFPGKYKVTISSPETPGQEKPRAPRPVVVQLEPNFEDSSKTPLEKTVQAASNVIDLTVRRAKARK